VKVATILNQFLFEVTPSMHKVRRKSLNAMVTSLISGAHLSVTGLGRHIKSATSEKHQIKRSMRLCSNPHLYSEVNSIYSFTARQLVGMQKQPIILVDWSDLDPRKQHFLFRASIAVEGRSLTLYEKVYGVDEKEKPVTHQDFMLTLKAMLPDACKPIIVSDAGFRVPWFELVESLGWDFVGRVRNKTMCRKPCEPEWSLIKTLYQHACVTPVDLGRYLLRRKDSFECCFVAYKQKGKGRKKLTATGERARRSSNSLSNASREQEPWLLATSLPTNSARKIANIYKTRMQIEESFKDLKTGLNFNESNTRTYRYLSVLLLLAMLAQYVLFLLGMAVKLSKQHLRYQANSIKTKAVLSYQFIGLRAFKDRYLKLRKADWHRAKLKIQELMQESLNV